LKNIIKFNKLQISIPIIICLVAIANNLFLFAVLDFNIDACLDSGGAWNNVSNKNFFHHF
jgi:hypothetical protein